MKNITGKMASNFLEDMERDVAEIERNHYEIEENEAPDGTEPIWKCHDLEEDGRPCRYPIISSATEIIEEMRSESYSRDLRIVHVIDGRREVVAEAMPAPLRKPTEIERFPPQHQEPMPLPIHNRVQIERAPSQRQEPMPPPGRNRR